MNSPWELNSGDLSAGRAIPKPVWLSIPHPGEAEQATASEKSARLSLSGLRLWENPSLENSPPTSHHHLNLPG